jgi:hypothetical protein
MHPTIQQFFTEYAVLLGKTEFVFKKAQTVADEIDPNVLNEIRYSNRGLASALSIIATTPDIQATDEKISVYLLDAKKALCIAINDSIDNVVLNTRSLNKDFKQAYPDASISQTYGKEKYNQLLLAIKHLEDEVAETRDFRDTRTERYEAMARSDELKQLVTFVQLADELESDLRLIQLKAKQDARVSAWTRNGVLVALLAIIISVVMPLVQKMIENTPK